MLNHDDPGGQGSSHPPTPVTAALALGRGQAGFVGIIGSSLFALGRGQAGFVGTVTSAVASSMASSLTVFGIRVRLFTDTVLKVRNR